MMMLQILKLYAPHVADDSADDWHFPRGLPSPDEESREPSFKTR